MERLSHHEWRGNVRELRNVVERAIILFPNMQINADQVDTLFRRRNSNAPTTQLVREPGRSSPSCSLNGRGIDLKQHLAEMERPYIAAALAYRKSVGKGKSVSVRLDLGVRRTLQKQNTI